MKERVESKEAVKPSSIDRWSNGAGVKPINFVSVRDDVSQQVEGEIVEESLLCISVNGFEIVSFMCSPRDQKQMAIGFLFNERIIEGLDEIRSIHLSKNRSCVDVWINRHFSPPDRQIKTSGCGGGTTFDDLSERAGPIRSEFHISSAKLADFMRQLQMGAELYRRARGIHTAALADQNKLILQVEDIGRHNCLDKLAGYALTDGIDTRDHILLSSGRISSEMIGKARRMDIPVVCSRTSPTSLSVALADSWNIALVAYLRQNRMRVYTHSARIDLTRDNLLSDES